MPTLGDLNATPPQLASSLQQPAGKGDNGGFSLFGWHPQLPNLGGITAIKQLASGFIGLPEQAYHVGEDVFKGNWGDLNPLNPDTTVGKFTYGFEHGVENAATSVAGAVGVPFTRYNLGDEVLAPVLAKLNEMGPQAHDKDGNEIPFKPSTAWTRPGGPIAGAVQDIATAAIIAGPVAGALGKGATAAGAASDAATIAAAEGTGTAEAAATAAEAAARSARAAQVAHNFAHPYQYLGARAADVVLGAREAVSPALSETPGAAPTAAEILKSETPKPTMNLGEVGQALRSLMDPQTAAAQVATRSTAEDALLSQHLGEPTTTLYRGQEPGTPSGEWFTNNPERAAKYGELRSVRVPESKLAEMEQATKEAAARGEGQPTKGDYYLGPQHQDWADAAHEVPKPELGAEKLKLPQHPGEVIEPEVRTEQTQDIRTAEETARQNARESAVATTIAKRLATPPPAWAQRLTAAMPDSVNRVLAQFATPVTNSRFRAVARDYARIAETAQRAALTSDTVVQMQAAARNVLDAVPEASRFDTSHYVGEEVAAEATGEKFVESFIKGGGRPDLVDALKRTARNGYDGLPQELRDAMTPEQSAQFDSAIQDAANSLRDIAAQHKEALLASRPGAQGIEQAVLGDTSPAMTPSEVKMYRRAMRELREQALKRAQIPDAEMQRVAAANREMMLGDRLNAEADRLTAKVGVFERTAAELKESLPLAVRAENIEGALDQLVAGALNGRITYDVGRNVPVLAAEGVEVNIAKQFDMPINADPTFVAQVREAARQAMLNPKTVDGGPYGPGTWAGPDARLVMQTHTGPDGAQWISGHIGMSTWGGKPLPRWLAVGLGEMHRMDQGVDLASNLPIHFSGRPDVQNLWANYGQDAINPKSAFSKFASKLAKDASEIQNLDPSEVDAALRYYMTQDYSLSRSNPDAWKQGDFFRQAATSVGKGRPGTLSLLAQSVLNLGSSEDAFLAATQGAHALTPEQINLALKWYYDSHDYIEQMWRGKTVKLLDGTERDAAEVFYDLLAVTSVMASPKQNLGRALMAFANMEDFVSSRKNAFAAARSMMRELEKRPPTLEELNGTKLSSRFLTPEIQRLTNKTAMTNQPKYNVFDVLAGRLKLGEATNEQIAQLPEWWTGTAKGGSDANMARSQVLRMLDTQGATGPALDAYRAWDARMTELENANLQGREFKPITEAQNEDKGVGVNQSRKVSAAKFEQLAQKGKAKLAEMKANSSPPEGLDTNWDAAVASAYASIGEEWGGATIDAHTGEVLPSGADRYAVTTKPPGMKAITGPPGMNEARFAALMRTARTRFADELAQENGHLGIFWNGDTGKIEIDPVTVLSDTHDVEAVGAASHSKGGAFHFASGNGYWVPYVGNEFESQASLSRALKETRAQGQELLKAYPDLRRAHEQALAEHHGSNLLWKMRSFRNNLADPHNSLTVTLDSVMAQMYGMHENEWAGANRMGLKSDDVRAAAAKYGVKPHEMQALNWVYTKIELGRQDFGRLLAHHDIAQGELDAMEKMIAEGQTPNARAYDPLHDYWDEELGYSREALDKRQQKTYLLAQQRKGVRLTPDQLAELADLKSQNLRSGVRSQEVFTAANRENLGEIPASAEGYATETRHSIPWDANKLKTQEARYAKYLDVRNEIQQSIANGDIEEARALLTSYVAKQKRGILGDAGGSLKVVGEETRATPGESAYEAEQALRAGKSKAVPPPNEWDPTRPSVDELHQQFNNQLRGALLLTPDKSGRLMMRLFQNAALDTLAHEGGHLLRQILPHESLSEVVAHYPHLLDAALTPAREAAEESFVADLMLYMRKAVVTGTHEGPLADVFEKIGATIEEQHAAMLDSPHGRALSPDIHAFWTRLFHPNIEAPDQIIDPISMRSVVSPANAEVKQFRWESDAQFAQRARQYGEARANIEAAKYKAALAARAAAKADSAARRMWASILNNPTDVEAEAQRLGVHAHGILEKLGRKLEDPNHAQVPREWQPMWDAFSNIRQQVKDHPELAEYVDEIPATFSAVLRSAAEHGFEPTYIPDMTWEQANRLMFGHIQLGKMSAEVETKAGSRSANQGILRANALGDRSMTALAAGAMDATHELYSNKLIEFVEQHWAQPFTAGSEIPAGWVPWDPERTFILTGTRASGERVANAGHIIPVEVQRAIKSMSKRYDHWTFHTLSKVTKPWITYNLTLSPKWYLHIFVSNVVRALAEGVRLKDWTTTIRQWKTGTLPEEVYGHSITSMLGDEPTLIGRSIAEAKRSEGMKQALGEVRGRVRKVHDVLDEINRGAVFEKTLRTTGSREQALTRSYEAMVDYGNLSPFERGVTRQLIPFYPFYKGMVKLLARFPADHPAATALLMMSGKMHEEYLQDQFGGKLPDAYRGVANIGGLHNFTILDPFINPTNLVDIHGINNTFNPFIDIMLRDAYDAASPGTGTPGMDATGHPVTQVNLLKALGSTLAGSPLARLGGQVAGGGDVYKKNPGVVGGIGQFLGVPTTPNVGNIQNAVAQTTGGASTAPPLSFDEALKKALAAKPTKARTPATAQQKAVRAAVRRIRGTKSHRTGGVHVKGVRKPRLPRHH